MIFTFLNKITFEKSSKKIWEIMMSKNCVLKYFDNLTRFFLADNFSP